MSWLVKNSDEGQPRPPMFQQGKQHHSVISLVLFYFVTILSQFALLPASMGRGYPRHKSFLTSKPCLSVAAGGLVAEAVRRLENKVRLNARLVELRGPTNQFALNPK